MEHSHSVVATDLVHVGMVWRCGHSSGGTVAKGL